MGSLEKPVSLAQNASGAGASFKEKMGLVHNRIQDVGTGSHFQKLLLSLRADTYLGGHVLHTLAGIVLGLCAIRSLLRYHGRSKRMLIHVVHFLVGLGVCFLIYLDPDIENPLYVDYWVEKSQKDSESNWYKKSRSYKLSRNAYIIYTVLLVYSVSIAFSAMVAVSCLEGDCR